METRKKKIITMPPEPAHEVHSLETEYACDGCGADLMEHNSLGGGYKQINEDKEARNQVRVIVASVDHGDFTFSEVGAGIERISRDYCDSCLAARWPQISRLLAFPETS